MAKKTAVKVRPPMVATSLVSRFSTAAISRTSRISIRPIGHLDAADADVERHLELARPGVLEAQHDHRQRLEHEAPDDAEGIRLAQQDHVAPADEDGDQLQADDQVAGCDRSCRSAGAA